MKVALVCPDGLSLVLFFKEVVKSLKRMPGTDVVVLSSDSIYRNEIEALGARSVTVEIRRFIDPIQDIKCLVALWRLMRREKFDAVITFYTKANILGTVAARLAGVDYVAMHIGGLGSVFVPSRDLRSRVLRRLALCSYRLAGTLCNKVWFTNKNDVAYFKSHKVLSDEKVVLTRFFLDTDYYSPSSVSQDELDGLRREFDIRPGDKVVVMVARMIWPKGIREFVEASSRLRHKYARLKFLLVAPLEDGSPNSVPEAYVRAQEESANFHWLGFRSDVRGLYALADVAVLPSYYKEGGYPRALTEPMAMGKPIITTDSPDCRETVEEGKNGLLVPIKDAVALAAAIEILITDPNKSLAFGAYSRLKAERDYDEKKIVPSLLTELALPAQSRALRAAERKGGAHSMRAALICPDGRSVSVFFKEIIRDLLSGDQASVIVLCDAGDYRSEIEALGATCVPIEMSRYATPASDVRYVATLCRALRQYQINVVVNVTTKPNIYGPIAARLAGVTRIVSHNVGLGYAFNAGGGVSRAVLRELVLLMYRIAYGLSHAVWFTNQGDVAYFLRRRIMSPSKTVVSRMYLDTDDYSPDKVNPEAVAALRRDLGLDDRDKVVVMVARLIWAKGIREFVEAADLLQRSRPDVKWVLLGIAESDSPDAVPASYVRDRFSKPNLRHLPFLPDTRPLYALADIAVLPSYYSEGGYPRALLEPMSMGKPIITTDSPHTRGTVEVNRNGLLIPLRSAAALAEAVAGLLADPDRLAQFGQYARHKACRDFDEREIVRTALAACGVLGPPILPFDSERETADTSAAG